MWSCGGGVLTGAGARAFIGGARYRGDGEAQPRARRGLSSPGFTIAARPCGSFRYRCSRASAGMRWAPAWRSRWPATCASHPRARASACRGQARHPLRRRSGALADARRLGADAPDSSFSGSIFTAARRANGASSSASPRTVNRTRRSSNGSRRLGLRPSAPSAEALDPRLGRAQCRARRRRRYRGFRRSLAIAGTEARHGKLSCREGGAKARRWNRARLDPIGKIDAERKARSR